MSQNLITLSYNPDQIAAIGKSLGELEVQLQDLIALTPGGRRAVSKMGLKSESFCRQTLNALQLNPQIVPPSLDVEDAQADLAVLDQLRPLFERLRKLAEKAADSELALGSDVMDAALHGYRALKAFGKSQGLDGLRKDLSGRFQKSPRPAPAPATA